MTDVAEYGVHSDLSYKASRPPKLLYDEDIQDRMSRSICDNPTSRVNVGK